MRLRKPGTTNTKLTDRTLQFLGDATELLHVHLPDGEFTETGLAAFSRARKLEWLKLPEDKATHTFSLPEDLRSSNVLVEIAGGGQTKVVYDGAGQ